MISSAVELKSQKKKNADPIQYTRTALLDVVTSGNNVCAPWVWGSIYIYNSTVLHDCELRIIFTSFSLQYCVLNDFEFVVKCEHILNIR